MSNITIALRYDRINKNEEAPINFFYIKNRKLFKISTGILVNPGFWDKSKSRIKRGHPNANRLNAYLSSKLADLQNELLKQESVHKTFTPKKLKEKIFGHEPTNIFQFAEEFIIKYKERCSIGTFNRYKAVMAKLEKYNGGKNLYLQDVDAQFLTKYEKYLRTKLGNRTNTIHANFRVFRTLFNEAYRSEMIEHSDIPFNKYKLVSEKTQRTYLTADELLKLEQIPLNHNTNISLHRDMFIFAAYCGGIRISDILLMKWKQFDGVHIQFTIKKTGSQLSLKLPQKAMETILKYKPEIDNPENFIFPVLHNNLKITDPVQVDNAISCGNALVNKSLKVLAKRTGITKHISFHISRHTWATQALLRGISIDKVSKLMGHANIRETQIYAKIVNEELDKAMEAFNE